MAFNYVDALLNTLANYAPPADFSYYLPYQRSVVNDLINQDRISWRGGFTHEFRGTYRVGATSVQEDFDETRNPTFDSSTYKGSIDMMFTRYTVAWTEREIKAQLGSLGPFATSTQKAQAIVDVIKERHTTEALGHLAAEELRFFQLPDTSSNVKLWGLPYHMPSITSAQIATSTAVGAFQGANGTGFSTWCGIDRSSATYAGLRTYNAGWQATSAAAVSMTPENLKRLARAMKKIDFEGPMDVGDLKLPKYSRFRLLTDLFNIEALENVAVLSNDTLGNDALKYRGTGLRIGSNNNGVVANGLRVTWAPPLDDTTNVTAYDSHPFIGINGDCVKLIVDPDTYMTARKPASDALRNPTLVAQYVDSLRNLRLIKPQQAGFVISWVA